MRRAAATAEEVAQRGRHVRRTTLRRAAALWLVLFGVYGATIGLDAFRDAEYGGDEPHFLLTAKSLVEDGSPDLTDEYRSRDYGDIYPYELEPRGSENTKGLVNEPHGVGFPLLIAPAYALGGPVGVELFLAALAALAVALAYALALRVVPDPWALSGTFLVGLSPPMLAYGTGVFPALPAAAVLAAALLLALRLMERPTRTAAFGCFALLGMLPWLSTPLLAPGAVIAVFAVRALWAQRRRMLAIGAVEVAGFSLTFFASLNIGLFDGLTPASANLPGQSPTGTSDASEYLERAYRFVALWIDRDFGLLRWAPVLALAWLGAWLAWRERRGGLARIIPALRNEEVAAGLCVAVVGMQLLVAIFLAPTMFGFWFPGRHVMPVLPLLIPLVALGLRRAPRAGAVLGLVGVAASVWLYVDVRWGGGGLTAERPDAPWGPLVNAWPYFGSAAWPYVLAALIAIVVVMAFAVDERTWRRVAGRARVGAGAAGIVAAVVVAGATSPGSTAEAGEGLRERTAGAVPVAAGSRVPVGRSVQGRRIVATRLGDPASPRKVLVVGAIHGDEPGGPVVTRMLRRRWAARVPSVDLWVVDSFNPDGRRRGTRGNARGVDLNRNFPYRWQRGTRGSRYWGGPRPLSEPESRAIRALVLRIRPDVTIWYHQPWGAVLACRRRGNALPRRYARLARMRTACRGRGLRGTATSWQNARVGGRAFVVELAGGRVGARTARRHARAAAIIARGD